MNPNVPFAPDPERARVPDGPVGGLGDDDVGRVDRLSAAVAVFLKPGCHGSFKGHTFAP